MSVGGKNKFAHQGMPSRREALAFVFLGLVITFVCYSVFSRWPDLDIELSRMFTNEASRFYLQSDGLITMFRKGVLFLIFGFYVLVIGGWIDAYNRQTPVLGHEWHRWSFLGTAGLLGPVLIVNVILKGNWGRARPQFLEEFGGSLEFTPFWVWSDQCRDNCSFSSGEVAAVAMVFLSLAFLLRPIGRYLTLAVGLVCAIIISWKRLALGAHFLSDTIMSVALMCMSVSLVYWFFYLRPANWIGWFDQKQNEKLAAKAARSKIAK